MHTVLSAAAALKRGIGWVVVAMYTVMVTAAIAQVIFRQFILYPLGWTEELARIMLVWSVFLCVAVLASERKLLTVDAILLVLPPRLQALVIAFAQLISGLFLGLMAYLAIRLVGLAGAQTSPALEIPYSWIYASLPVGMTLTTVYLLLNGGIHLHRWLFVRDLDSLAPGELARDAEKI